MTTSGMTYRRGDSRPCMFTTVRLRMGIATLMAFAVPGHVSAQAAPLADIRYHAIVEAPVDRVWAACSKGSELSKWFVHRALEWRPETGRPYSVVWQDDQTVRGTFIRVEPGQRIKLAWSDSSTTLTLEVVEIDGCLSMLTLVHAGFDDAKQGHDIQRDICSHRWRAAMMKFHRLFLPPVVDTRMHRPRVEGVFIDRSLIVNGGFEHDLEGRYDGVAWAWETNTARSSSGIHLVDDKNTHGGRRAQCIRRPPDWSSFAVQQFTSQLEPMIRPGERYRLEGWVKAEGIRNPAGWYKLGLWFTDKGGTPIGDSIKNDRLTDGHGDLLLNHDWRRVTIEAVAPPNAARAVVILSGHWDEAGTVWYDDITLWKAGPAPSTRDREIEKAP